MSESRNSYGWVIVGVATLALVVSNGLSIGGFPLFYRPIREEFVLLGEVDQSHAETFVANGANIVFLMSGVFSLLGGWLLTRIRLKVLMLVGSVMLGSGLVLHSQANTAEVVYFARFLMGASLGFVGVTGYLADQAGGDYTNAFYGVTIVAGLAFISTLLILVLENYKVKMKV